ncbi:chemotaxis protein [Salipiger sp. IMCC34102]|uniref:CheR family methyltransferase n=1 Tax=Salipiger sp. IMCC34102 TaxID=2510647 RepID=UPI00101BC48B|nr:protein-glutamate O-methyltransferase [Salipiger sp. IMCC34102]RYH00949.1 chemotaxis protein [Salipiger sp. IMCC34102]
MTDLPNPSSAALDLDLSAAQYARITAILKERAGIVLAEGSMGLVISRLARHLRRLGHRDFDTYLELVTTPAGAAERDQMINALTTNTTRFFREPDHFECLARQAMPRLTRKAKAGGRVRIWSAGCSSGEEAYSIAATVLGTFPDAAEYDLRILATDINSHMLSRAEEALYDIDAGRDLSPAARAALFEPARQGGSLVVRRALRDLVTFRYLNLIGDWPISGPFDVIFCRNVAIYLGAETQQNLWAGLARMLDEEGLLFIGHSEHIGPPSSDRLELFAPTSFRRPRVSPIPPHPSFKECQHVHQDLS